MATIGFDQKKLNVAGDIRVSLFRNWKTGYYMNKAAIITEMDTDTGRVFENLYKRIWRLGYYKPKLEVVKCEEIESQFKRLFYLPDKYENDVTKIHASFLVREKKTQEPGALFLQGIIFKYQCVVGVPKNQLMYMYCEQIAKETVKYNT